MWIFAGTSDEGRKKATRRRRGAFQHLVHDTLLRAYRVWTPSTVVIPDLEDEPRLLTSVADR